MKMVLLKSTRFSASPRRPCWKNPPNEIAHRVPTGARSPQFDSHRSTAEAQIVAAQATSIAFNPMRPCVCINGTMLGVGEKLGDLQVVAINRESATLVGADGAKTVTMR